MSEYAPPTDEELATWDSKYDFDDGTVRRLIAEVRRLRAGSNTLAMASEEGSQRDFVHPVARTLTLPNGTVVRAGEFFVDTIDGWVLEIEAIGNRTNQVFAIEWSLKDGAWIEDGESTTGVEYLSESMDLRPWSEVYPDRPVPGGHK